MKMMCLKTSFAYRCQGARCD